MAKTSQVARLLHIVKSILLCYNHIAFTTRRTILYEDR